MISPYLIDIIILLLAAVVMVPFFQAARLGAVPGFLISGVIVGPSGFGVITNVDEIAHLAEIGVVLLLFVIGIELKPSRLWLMRRLVFGMGTLQVLLTGALISGVCYLFLGTSMRAAILIGPALALSSTAFVLQILTEQKLLTSQYGRGSIAVLLMQDLAVVPLLALIPLLVAGEMTIEEDIWFALGKSVVIFALVVVVGRFFLHPILNRVAISGNPETFTASAVLIVLGSALATEHAGLSMAMGAFLAGMLISDSFYRHQVLAEIQPFRGLLLGIFFMSMGMALNLQLLLENPFVSVTMVLILIGLKFALLFPLTYLFGLKTKNGLAVSLLLAQSGEFALVLFSMAFQNQLLSEEIFQQLLLVVLLSMLATPLLASISKKLVRRGESSKLIEVENGESASVVLAGFGRVGHRIGEILAHSGTPFVALDGNARIVEKQRARGHPVFYGDVRKPEVLRAAGVAEANTIIVTINDPFATQEVVASLRKSYPDKHIYARGHSLHDCCELKRLGASEVVSENIEASLSLARMVLDDFEVSKDKQVEILGEFRRAYQEQIETLADSEHIRQTHR